MKKYILVHHRCEQDPRVSQLVKSLRELGHECVFIGLDSRSYWGRSFIHLNVIHIWGVIRAIKPLRDAFFRGPLCYILSLGLILGLILVILPFLFILFGFWLAKFAASQFQWLRKTGLRATQPTKSLLKMIVYPPLFFVDFLRSFATFHQFLKNEPDIKVVHCNDLETLLVGVYFKITCGCYLIYDAHEFFPYQASWLKGFWRRLLIAYEKYLIQFVDEKFMVSAPLAKLMESEYNLKKPFVVVPNVFSIGSICKEVGGGSNLPVRFYYAGVFLEERGIIQLIEEWENIDSAKATLHLRGPFNKFYSYCQGRAKELGLYQKSVYFYESVTEDELINAAHDFDVGIIPYLPVNVNNRLCCPNKLSQYMLAGNAILSNNLPNVIGYIERYQNGTFYDLNKQNSFIDAVYSLCDQRKLHGMKRNSLYWAEKEYNWEIQGRSFFEAYSKLGSAH